MTAPGDSSRIAGAADTGNEGLDALESLPASIHAGGREVAAAGPGAGGDPLRNVLGGGVASGTEEAILSGATVAAQELVAPPPLSAVGGAIHAARANDLDATVADGGALGGAFAAETSGKMIAGEAEIATPAVIHEGGSEHAFRADAVTYPIVGGGRETGRSDVVVGGGEIASAES